MWIGIESFLKFNALELFINTTVKKLISNVLTLSIVQGLNYLLPLITIPYLIKVIGIEKFGLLAFATIIVSYFQTLIDYGFNLNATKNVALNRYNVIKLSEIFSAVIMIQLFFFIFSAILLLGLITFFDTFFIEYLVYWFTFFGLLGHILFPMWFFQGIEQMRYITFFHTFAKLFFTVMIFVFIKEKNDFLLIPVLNSCGLILSGIYAFILVQKKFTIRFKFQHFSILFYYLKEGWHIFISRIFVTGYMNMGLLMLGILVNNMAVGYYSVAEKIIGAVHGVYVPMQQTFYPHLVSLKEKHQAAFFSFIKKIVYLYSAIGLVLFCVVNYFATEIIVFINGNFDNTINSIYFILTFTILLSPFGSLLTHMLVIEKKDKEFYKITQLVFFIHSVTAYFLITFINQIGLALSTVLTQLIVISLCYYVIKKESSFYVTSF